MRSFVSAYMAVAELNGLGSHLLGDIGWSAQERVNWIRDGHGKDMRTFGRPNLYNGQSGTGEDWGRALTPNPTTGIS